MALASAASGCAFGHKIEYRGVSNITLDYKLRSSSVLGVIDRRDARNEDWVGLQKSMVGIPYPVGTTSGRPLATDFGELLAGSLNRRFAVSQIVVPRGSDDRTARRIIGPADDSFGILVTLKRWETSAMFKMVLTYDVGLEVFDSKGNTLAFTSAAGEEVFDQSNVKRPTLDVAVSSIFSDLFNHAEVQQALGAPPKAPVAGAERQGPIGTGFSPPPPGVEPQPAKSGSTAATTPPADARRPLKSGTPPSSIESQPPPATPATPTESTQPPLQGKAARSPAKPTPPAEKPREKAKCTVDQILKMKEMKFNDGQIKAACE